MLSIESLTTNTTEHAIGSSIIARATCHSNMFIDCFSSLSSAKIGLVLGFLATKVFERVFCKSFFQHPSPPTHLPTFAIPNDPKPAKPNALLLLKQM